MTAPILPARSMPWLIVLLAATLLLPWRATLAFGGWGDASSIIRVVSQSPRYFDRINRSFFSDVRVQNVSGGDLDGLFRLVVTASSIAVKNPSDVTGSGEPFVSIDRSLWPAGETVSVRVSFEMQRGDLVFSLRPEWIAQSSSPNPEDPVQAPIENQPPLIFECAAPDTAQVGVEYSYTPQFHDNDGDTLTYRTDFRQPPWTSFDPATGRLWGTPSASDIGLYQFVKIFASDGQAETKCGGFRITVQNSAPTIAGTPATAVFANEPYEFIPSASDINGDSLTFSIVNKPSWASFDPTTGRLSGSPYSRDVGLSDAIQIKVSDGRATTALTPFTIEVPNRPPELNPSDPGPALTATPGVPYEYFPLVFDRDAHGLFFSLDGPGWLSLTSTLTGRVVGTPTAADVGSHRVRISATDGYAEEVVVADYFLNVGNSAPVLGNTPPTSVDVGHPYAFVPDVSDADGGTLAFALVNAPAWLGVDPFTGVLAGTPTQADLGTWQAVDYCVGDGVATTCVGAFDIEVRNQAPSIAGTPAASIEVGQSYGFTPTAGDNNGDSLSFSVQNLPDWAGFDPANGTLSGSPAETDIGLWNDIVIAVTDGIETVSLPAFDLDVLPDPNAPVNTPPTIGGSPALVVRVGEPYSFTPVANDADGDTLSFSIENLPAWASFDDGTGALTGTPTPADADTLFPDIRIGVTDGLESVALTPFDIQVETGNRAPSIAGTPEVRVTTGELYGFTPTADDADGDPLTFAIVNPPSWASFDPATGALTGTPQSGDEGLYEAIVISVGDGIVSTALAAFEILVEAPAAPNLAPTIGGTPAATAKVGGSYAFTPTASDPDGDPLLFSVTNLPAWASFDEHTGTLSGSPAIGDLGSYPGIGITVSDGELSAGLPAFAIAVVENQAPRAELPSSLTVKVGEPFSVTVTASDPDGDTLSFDQMNRPAWVDFDPATGTYSGTPTRDDIGTYYYIRVRVSDGAVQVTSNALTLNVRNQPPVVSGIPQASVAIGGLYSFTPTAVDPNGDPITGWQVQNLPSWAGFDPTTGTLSGTPGLMDAGDHKSIKIGASDGLGTGWGATFVITVLNQAPVISGVMPGEAQVGVPFSFTPTASDGDGHSLTFQMRNQIPSWLTLDPATGHLFGTPTRADIGTYRYTSIGANDGFATSFLPNTAINVRNQSPTIGGTPPTGLDVGETYGFTPVAADINGDDLTFTVENLPAWLTFDPATGTLAGAPTKDDAGTYRNLKLSVTDGLASTSLATFSIQVDNANSPPVITGNPPLVIAPGRNYSFTPAARDIDAGDVITFSVQNLPSWASFDPATGTLAGVPAPGDLGSLTTNVVISASDGDGSASLDPFDIEVVAAFDEVAAALASGDFRYVSDVDDLLDAAIDELQIATSNLAPIQAMLRHLRDDAYNFDWSVCASEGQCTGVEGYAAQFGDGAKLMRNLLQTLDKAKVDLFAQPDLRLEKLLVLIGDWYRERVRFPMDKVQTDNNTWLQSHYAEFAQYSARPLNLPMPDTGNFGASDFRWVTPETVQVDMVSRKSFRAAGIYALPGETLRVTRLDTNPVATGIFINTIRDGAGRIWEGSNAYRRPSLLRGVTYALAPGETLELTPAIGGLVQVTFDTNDVDVSLRFENVGRHPVWRGPADTADFLAGIERSIDDPRGYNWVELVTPYFELHSRLSNFQETLASWPDLDELAATIDYGIHDHLRGLAGFHGDGITPIPEVAAIAAANGWSFKPWEQVQHANMDQASCGSGCSGNPYDAFWSFSPLGHGDLHEVGHNVEGGRRFTGWPAHAYTNYYSYYTNSEHYFDTGLAPNCQNLSFKTLFEIVQDSMHQPNPGAYVRARINAGAADADAPEDAGDYPEKFAVDWNMGATIYVELMMMAQRNGALENGWRLRTLVHVLEYNFDQALKNDAAWLAGRDWLGFGQYSRDEAKALSDDDFLLIAMSYATGLDYREPFDMFGIAFSAKAAAQVEALALSPLPREVFVSAPSDFCTGLDKPALPADGTQIWPLGAAASSAAGDEPPSVFGSLGAALHVRAHGAAPADEPHICTGAHDGTEHTDGDAAPQP